MKKGKLAPDQGFQAKSKARQDENGSYDESFNKYNQRKYNKYSAKKYDF